jgi:protein-L-isoaspartate(D-aspartate) O-methyltransferase
MQAEAILAMDYARARRTMVDNQIRTFDVQDHEVLAAMSAVPRELFVPTGRQALAYTDQVLTVGPAGAQRALLVPMVLARMLQAVELRPGERVLDVGGGTGYGAAVAARVARQPVRAIEDSEALVSAAKAALRLAEAPVEVVQADLSAGLPLMGPFEVIIVHGAMEVEPQGLLDQLSDGGRLVGIRGRGRAGRAVVYTRAGSAFGMRAVFDAFAPTLPAFREAPAFVL